ncbi:MAG: DCL family protein [Lentilitoribacter sp.]
MARGKPLTLSSVVFETKQEAKNFFKSMLQKYTLGARVSEEDSIHLNALLMLHSEREEKVGTGVDYFQVMKADYGTQCFCVVRTDGTAENFSYIHCISPKR